MTSLYLKVSRFRVPVFNFLSLILSLIIFRAFLLPNTFPFWFDHWRNVESYHFGFQGFYIASLAVCVVTGIIWTIYSPMETNDANLVGLWLVTGAWLTITCITIIVSQHNTTLVAREVLLLIGYISGMIAARLYRQLDQYISVLIIIATIQSIIAIAYQCMGIHVLYSGNVARAGGTFNTPSQLYLIPLFVLPFAIQRIFSSNKSISSAFYMLCSSSILAALVLTWERSGFFAVCIGLFWLTKTYVKGKRQIISFALVLFLVCSVFFVRSNGPVNYMSSMRSIHSRSYLFESGVIVFTHHILNGVGIGCLSIPVTTMIHGSVKNIQMIQPYNQYLYWLDEMGVVGGGLIILFILFIYRTISSSSLNFAHGVAAVWISVLIAGVFNTFFGCSEFSCGNMLIGSLLGITLRMKHEELIGSSLLGVSK